MPRRFPLFLALVLAVGACKRERPGPVVAMEPRPNPPVGVAAAVAKPADNPRARLRQNRWLAQFWEELTPAQRRQVESRMRRAQPPLASNQESAGQTWDALGLADRDRLVFGRATPPRPAVVNAEAPDQPSPQ